MQTIYTTSSRLAQRTADIIDLGEYRRKLAMTQPPAAVTAVAPIWESAPEGPAPRARTNHAHRCAWAMDICASLGVFVMTLAFTVQILTI